MILFTRSDSKLADETNLPPLIELLPEPTAPFNSYDDDREDDASDEAKNGLACVQEMIMGAIEELLEKLLPAKVKDYFNVKGENHEPDDDHDDETVIDSRGLDFDGGNLKNERFKVRIVDIGGSAPIKQVVQDNKNVKK